MADPFRRQVLKILPGVAHCTVIGVTVQSLHITHATTSRTVCKKQVSNLGRENIAMGGLSRMLESKLCKQALVN
eukprot:1159220-Pelagomonas_calceolata.AAC.2